MAVTLTQLESELQHALGNGVVSTKHDQDTIINEAGRCLFQLHPSGRWKFSHRPSVHLGYTVLTITDADWTESSKTLTSTGDFASYLHEAGAVFTATDGTGVTTGDYPISSKTDDDKIVLFSSLSTSETDLSGVVDGTLALPYVNLPSDFKEIDIVRATDSFNVRVELVSIDEIEELRGQQQSAASRSLIRAAVSQPSQNTVTSSFPVPRLELYPTPTATDADALVISYYADWKELSSGTDKANIPIWAETLLRQLVRAFALGYEEGEQGNVDARIEQIVSSRFFAGVVARDARQQRQFGPIRGTSWQHSQTRMGWPGKSGLRVIEGSVLDPS